MVVIYRYVPLRKTSLEFATQSWGATWCGSATGTGSGGGSANQSGSATQSVSGSATRSGNSTGSGSATRSGSVTRSGSATRSGCESVGEWEWVCECGGGSGRIVMGSASAFTVVKRVYFKSTIHKIHNT